MFFYRFLWNLIVTWSTIISILKNFCSWLEKERLNMGRGELCTHGCWHKWWWGWSKYINTIIPILVSYCYGVGTNIIYYIYLSGARIPIITLLQAAKDLSTVSCTVILLRETRAWFLHIQHTTALDGLLQIHPEFSLHIISPAGAYTCTTYTYCQLPQIMRYLLTHYSILN